MLKEESEAIIEPLLSWSSQHSGGSVESTPMTRSRLLHGVMHDEPDKQVAWKLQGFFLGDFHPSPPFN